MIMDVIPILDFEVVHKLEFFSFYYSSVGILQFLHYLFLMKETMFVFRFRVLYSCYCIPNVFLHQNSLYFKSQF